MAFEERFALLIESGQASVRSVSATRTAIDLIENHYGFTLTEELGAPLVNHLAITLKRLLEGQELVAAPDAVWIELQDFPEEQSLASAILDALNDYLPVYLARDELGFLAIHLARLRIEAGLNTARMLPQEAAVMTVLGPVDPFELGVTAIHEHLWAASTSDRRDPDTRLDEYETVLGELQRFKQAGGSALVEVTTRDMGRDASILQKLSSASGVKVIAATGFYKGSYSPRGGPRVTWDFLPPELRHATIDQIAQVFIRDVRDSIDETSIRAGIIGEIGTSFNQVLPDEERVFRAAARANAETGVPISTHTTLGTMGREQIQILKSEGADLRHVVLSHMDLASSTAYHMDLASQGVFLGFDTAGKEQYQPDETRIELIQALVQEGYGSQIVLSCDIGRRSLWAKYGGRGYAYLLEHFVPRLEAAGIPPATIHNFLVENPRRLLAF